MTDKVYGIAPPRVRSDWEACSMNTECARLFMRRHLVPEGYGAPIRAVAWERTNGDITLVVAEYPNGRRTEVRRSGHDFSTTLKWWSKPQDLSLPPRAAESGEGRGGGASLGAITTAATAAA